jgi:2-oxo-4-hydroxy-4-carboxy-5-ureidoimidazoline decarboxylase
MSEVGSPPHQLLNAWPRERARAELARCCASARWVEAMLTRRPFASEAQLHATALEVWASTADAQTRAALRARNLAYTARFGFTFIVCASGKSAAELLTALEARLRNAPEVELQIAAQQQAQITALRLAKLTP